MSLTKYQKKRKFKETSEPAGKIAPTIGSRLIFVIHKHQATHLHYDLRLEMEGVLKSWAVPKEPSMSPNVKRLAIMVEDHPFEYKDFEGIIPEGNYGAGTVVIWDHGYYEPLTDGSLSKINAEKELLKELNSGKLSIKFFGQKIKGEFHLVKLKGRKNNEWLFFKSKLNSSAAKSDGHNRNNDEIAKSEGVPLNDELLKWINKKLAGFKLPDKPFPGFVKPMLATLVDKPFNDPSWIFEVKWDGYRAMGIVNVNGSPDLISRNNKSFKNKFPLLISQLTNFQFNAVLDGEIVILDNKGVSQFQLLQNFSKALENSLYYYVFDILYFNGRDLKNLPLIVRKEILKKLIPENGRIRYSDHFENDGVKLLELSKEKGLEGIIAKRSADPYFAGVRAKSWLKIKSNLEQEAIICGFTSPKGSRKYFGSLVLGAYRNKELVFIGHSGGGFSQLMLENIYKRLAPIIIDRASFSEIPDLKSGVSWVKPEIVIEVHFNEWTSEGIMRQPVFKGIREDKDPGDVTLEIPNQVEQIVGNFFNKNASIENNAVEEINSTGYSPAPHSKTRKQPRKNTRVAKQEQLAEKEITINKQKIRLTNLNKIFWPEEAITKGMLLDYYEKVGDYMIPYLKDRPQSMLRHPNGIIAKGFFQKDVGDMPPDWIKTVVIHSESNDKDIRYLLCQNKAALLYMVNLGCIEINPWNSTYKDPKYPTYAILDIDPKNIEFMRVIETARVAKEILDSTGTRAYLKTSGSKGLHILIPLGGKYTYEQSRNFAHLLAKAIHFKIPEFTSLERMPAKRDKMVYIDYLQNSLGQTLAAPYCVRPKPGATVSAPIDWEELTDDLSIQNFTIFNMPERLYKTGDIFKMVLGKGIDMEKSIRNLEDLLH